MSQRCPRQPGGLCLGSAITKCTCEIGEFKLGNFRSQASIDGLTVRINRFQRLGPGSTPGRRSLILFFILFSCISLSIFFSLFFSIYSVMMVEGLARGGF